MSNLTVLLFLSHFGFILIRLGSTAPAQMGRRVGRGVKGGVTAPGRQHSVLRKAVVACARFFSEGVGVGITSLGRDSLSIVSLRDEDEGRCEERLSVVKV
jgi:hypothetical protein